jgi:hypothetical protein
MATPIPTELEFFHRFLTEQLKSGGTHLSPEESLEAFRAYQRDLERCREDVCPALQRSLPQDVAALAFAPKGPQHVSPGQAAASLANGRAALGYRS